MGPLFFNLFIDLAKTENLLRFEFCRHLDFDSGNAIEIEDSGKSVPNNKHVDCKTLVCFQITFEYLNI